jgi:hypothetical protein
MKLIFNKLQFDVTLGKSSMLRGQTSSMPLVEAYEVDDKLKFIEHPRYFSSAYGATP